LISSNSQKTGGLGYGSLGTLLKFFYPKASKFFAPGEMAGWSLGGKREHGIDANCGVMYREDARAVIAAIGEGGRGWRVEGRGEWLGGVVGGDGRRVWGD